jgi:hypothetical protein
MQWSDHRLRVPMHRAAGAGRSQPATITEAHAISCSHLAKIV